MSEKIKYSDIAEDDLFKNAIDSANLFLKTLNNLEGQFKSILSASKMIADAKGFSELAEEIKKTEKALNDGEKAAKSLQSVDKERSKTLELLSGIEKERAKRIEELQEEIKKLREQTQQINKEVEDGNKTEKEANATKKQLSSQIKNNVSELTKYEKQLVQVTKAQVEGTKEDAERVKLQERLAKATSDQAIANEELKVQIAEQNKLNKEAAKERQGLISAYQKESKRLSELKKRYKDLAAAKQETTKEAKDLLKEIDVLDKRLKDIDNQVGENTREVGSYKKAIEGLKTSFGSLNTVLKASIIVEVLGQLSEVFKTLDISSTLLEKGLARVTIVLRTFASSVTNIFQAVTDGKGIIDAITEGFDGFGDKVAEAIEKNDKNIDSTKAFNRELTELEANLAKVRAEQERAQQAADDSTTSLQTQREENERALELAEKAAAIQLRISNERLKIARNTVEVEKLAGEVSLQAQQDLSTAIIEQVESQKELDLARQESITQRRQILSDIAELELDALIDGFDNQKAINERIIADETINLDRRKALLTATERALTESVERQIEVLNRQLSEIDPQAEPINLDELITLDAVALSERLQQLGLSEILTTRQLEVIRDLKTARQDITEATRDLNVSETELNETLADTILQEETLNKLSSDKVDLEAVLLELSEKRLQQEIENLKFRLQAVELGSNEEIALRQELNEKLIEQAQNRIEKEKELRENAVKEEEKALIDQAQRETEIREAAFSTLNSLIEQQSQQRLEQIDKEINAVSERQETLKALAEKGIDEAVDSLAEEQKKQAELERERERQLRRQQRLELAASALQTYTAKVEAGDPNPLASTITDIALLQQFVSSLPAFYKGSEKIADDLGAPELSGRDGYIVRVDGGERVMPTALNNMTGGISNLELAMLARDANVKPKTQDDQVVKGLQNVAKEIRQKPVYLGGEYDYIEKAVVQSTKRKNSLYKRHKKVGF